MLVTFPTRKHFSVPVEHILGMISHGKCMKQLFDSWSVLFMTKQL